MIGETGNRLTPKHVAIIMDGNRRWAEKRRLPVNAGHRAGAQALRKLAPEVEKMGIRHLTVYAFSTENWNRPAEEVGGLMRLLREYIGQYIDDTKKNNMRMSVIGDTSRLDADLRKDIKSLTEMTAENPGLHVHIAINYGGRDEITRAVRRLAVQAQNGSLTPEQINEDLITESLDTGGIPDPELLIRTGGNIRLSNFLLWQTAYTEIYFSEKMWPEFDPRDFREAVRWYTNVERRFGKR